MLLLLIDSLNVDLPVMIIVTIVIMPAVPRPDTRRPSTSCGKVTAVALYQHQKAGGTSDVQLTL